MSSLRCPYCHDAPPRTGRVCAGCLARHHDACWREAGACASCGQGAALVSERPPAPQPAAVWRWLCLLSVVPAGVFAFAVGLLWIAWASDVGDLGELLGVAIAAPFALAGVALPWLLIWIASRGPLAPPRWDPLARWRRAQRPPRLRRAQRPGSCAASTGRSKPRQRVEV